MNQRPSRIALPPWNLPFTVFTAEGALKQFAELKLRSVHPGGNQLYLADIEKRLGFTLTAYDARTWAKTLTEAANALEATEPKP
jgi:hypothetical protein